MEMAHGPLAGALSGLAAELRARTVTVADARGAGRGAGVVWAEDGLVVTNAHVARGDEARVELSDGRVLRARRVAVDAARDLAALRVRASGLPAAAARDPATLRPGELVVALGHPLGWTGALTLGVVHALDRLGADGPVRWIRADLRLAPGNSGGPLADAHGRVVGINTMVVGGLGLALPSSAVARFLAPAESRATLGVLLRPALVRGPALERAGYLVLETVAGGAAQRAGVLPGDVLLGLGRVAFEQPGDLERALDAARPGEVADLELLRAGRRLERAVMLRPAAEAARVA